MVQTIDFAIVLALVLASLTKKPQANAQEYHDKAPRTRFHSETRRIAETKLELIKAISGLWVLTILAKLGEEVAQVGL